MKSLIPRFFSPLIFLLFCFQISSVSSETISHRCPYSCEAVGYSKKVCRDWRVGDLCFIDVKNSAVHGSVICMRTADGSLRVKPACNKATEQRLNYSSLVGTSGPAGNSGPSGADGSLRIFGDGSAGDKIFAASTTFSDGNPQYTNITINSGVTLTIPSGTVLRCTGDFINNGTIIVQPGLRDANRFGENGRLEGSPKSAGTESPGGAGGSALPTGIAKQFVRVNLASGGNGYRERADTGGDGGGNFSVFCKGAVTNQGTIRADGTDASTTYRGGGAGGMILLASTTSVINSGTLQANGADGGPFLADDIINSTGYGPGGGGGGGIAHLIGPSVSNSGTVNLLGGQGGAAAGPGSVTAFLYFGGGGGGGAGGSGGQGGTVNAGNSGTNAATAAQAGSAGQLLLTAADPTSLY